MQPACVGQVMEPSHETQGEEWGRRLVRLAPDMRLSRDDERSSPVLCVRATEQVQLNAAAAAILELCDGSRNRDRIVVDALMRPGVSVRTSDLIEFLDAAKRRGWIIEVS